MTWAVLCIGDTPSRLLLYRSTLELEGRSVLLATEAAHAFRLCRTANISCVVMDHQRDGIMLTADIASIRPEIPIVFVVDEVRIPLQIYPLVEMFLSIDEALEGISQCVEEVVGRRALHTSVCHPSRLGVSDARSNPLHEAFVRWIFPW